MWLEAWEPETVLEASRSTRFGAGSLSGCSPVRSTRSSPRWRGDGYVADRGLAVTILLSLEMGRPLFLEGEAGVGKTEVAKVLAAILGSELIRLQCYEGLDVNHALYEWDYARQMLAIRLDRGPRRGWRGQGHRHHEPRVPAPAAIAEGDRDAALGKRPVLLIDELDRADEEFEAYLLELLSDFQVTLPEIGTIKAVEPPVVVVTSNRTREIHDALKRRCLYHWIDYPNDRTRGGDSPRPPARRRRQARPPVGDGHGRSALARPLQASRCGRDTGLGRGTESAWARTA